MASRVTIVQNEDLHYDSLDGKPLSDGETLYIKWPSGGIQQVTVEIHHVTIGSLRNGEVVEIPCHKACFAMRCTGSEARIYLRGFEAQRA